MTLLSKENGMMIWCFLDDGGDGGHDDNDDNHDDGDGGHDDVDDESLMI